MEITDNKGQTKQCDLKQVLWIKSGWNFTETDGVLEKDGAIAEFKKETGRKNV